MVFLYGIPLWSCAGSEIGFLGGICEGTATRTFVVLSPEETRLLLDQLESSMRLIGQLLYACGLRLLEGLWLRVKDVDFARLQIVVRRGKGGKDRTTMPSGFGDQTTNADGQFQRHLSVARFFASSLL